MKRKVVIGMLVLSMAVSATACSSKKEETAKTETSQSTDTEKASETADDAERAEVLYDVCAANVYQDGNGEDEQGRVLHTMFDQVIIENVSFK